MSAIRWPTGPYRFRHRQLGWLGRLLAWINILLGAGMLIFLSQVDGFQQYGANLLASLGFGGTMVQARVEETDCIHLRGNRGGVHHCDVTLVFRDGNREEIEVASSFDLEDRKPPRIARLGGRIALGYPLPLLAVQLFLLLLAALFCGGMVWIGWFMLGGGAFLLRRRLRGARIVEVDLLRRKMRGPLLADWTFAYDEGGRRRFATGAVGENPVILDGVVTRGAALVSKRGKPQLLTASYAPLDLDQATLDAVQTDVAASFHAPRFAAPARFAECAGGVADGPERDFVEGWRQAWDGPDVVTINAGIERRHAAAMRLSPKRVDALLRRCRECLSA